MLTIALDAILVMVPLEGVALWLFHRRTGRGIALRRCAANLGAGFFLVLAARSALQPAPDRTLPELAAALCLLLALLCHIADLAGRWRT